MRRLLLSRVIAILGAAWYAVRCFSIGSQVWGSKRTSATRLTRGQKKEKNPMEIPWWQLEEEADRLMAPQMPFRVEQVSPPPVKKLGYALLDSRTCRGDVINMGRETPESYVVSKVRFLYDLVGGRYRIRTKVLEAHTAVVWAIFINVAGEEIQVQTPRRYQINEKLAGLVEK
eukprot:symbB.v1.2.021733.t1/scaffold1896.1/size96813/4